MIAEGQQQDRDGGAWRLEEGTELLGRYESSGLTDAQYLVRRNDGQVIQVTALLFAVASCLDGDGDLERVASRAGAFARCDLSAENVAYLIETKLVPIGVVAGAGACTAAPCATPLLGLRLRFGVVPERVHRALTMALRPLFRPAVVMAGLVGLVMLDVWLVAHGSQVVDAGRQVLFHPQLMLLISGLAVASAAFHEIGHATAARYGGATPGVMGIGVYLIWPVFYTDVTDSYRLDRRGRLRTDLGGVYFNVLCVLVVAGAYFLTAYPPLLVVLVLIQLETLQQFLPFLRLDGYYVVSDLVGVPNLFAYLRPVLVTLTPGTSEQERGAARARLGNLRPWARRVITGWVMVTAPILLINVILLLVFAPAIAGAAWGALQLQAQSVVAAYDQGELAALLNGGLGVVLLASPVVGTLFVAAMAGRRIARGTRQWFGRRPLLAAVTVSVALAGLLMHAGASWPDTFTTALDRSRPAAEADAAGGTVEQASPRSLHLAQPGAPRALPPGVGGRSVAPAVPVRAFPTTPTVAAQPPPTPEAVAPPAALCGSRPSEAAPDGRLPWMEQLQCQAAA